jgi:hypothetical protein
MSHPEVVHALLWNHECPSKRSVGALKHTIPPRSGHHLRLNQATEGWGPSAKWGDLQTYNVPMKRSSSVGSEATRHANGHDSLQVRCRSYAACSLSPTSISVSLIFWVSGYRAIAQAVTGRILTAENKVHTQELRQAFLLVFRLPLSTSSHRYPIYNHVCVRWTKGPSEAQITLKPTQQ